MDSSVGVGFELPNWIPFDSETGSFVGIVVALTEVIEPLWAPPMLIGGDCPEFRSVKENIITNFRYSLKFL